MSDDLQSLQAAYAESVRDAGKYRREYRRLVAAERLHICKVRTACERCGYVLQPGTDLALADGVWCCARCYGEMHS